MYEGLTRLLIIFFTHPGILVSIPATGMGYSWARGLFQAAMVLVLHSPSEGKVSFSYTMQVVYWMILGIWLYVKSLLILAGK